MDSGQRMKNLLNLLANKHRKDSLIKSTKLNNQKLELMLTLLLNLANIQSEKERNQTKILNNRPYASIFRMNKNLEITLCSKLTQTSTERDHRLWTLNVIIQMKRLEKYQMI